MQTILVISSYVARGAVGLQATVPPLLKPGRDVIAIPTVILSNHPGYENFAGEPVSPNLLKSMIDSLEANGWLRDVTAIFSGYLPTPEHVALVCETVQRVRNSRPNLMYLCDPVLGDDPRGLYINADTAKAIRSQLVPLADIVTPNRFELSWLTGQPVENLTSISAISAAIRSLSARRVAVTSVRTRPNEVANLFITPSGTWMSSVEEKSNVPHGTGDLFAGLLLSALIDRASDDAALGYATGAVAQVIARSSGRQELELAAQRWTAAEIIPADTIALPA